MGILSTAFWMLVDLGLVVFGFILFFSGEIFTHYLGEIGAIIWIILLVINGIIILAIALKLQHGQL